MILRSGDLAFHFPATSRRSRLISSEVQAAKVRPAIPDLRFAARTFAPFQGLREWNVLATADIDNVLCKQQLRMGDEEDYNKKDGEEEEEEEELDEGVRLPII
jgi:hypothetical protein